MKKPVNTLKRTTLFVKIRSVLVAYVRAQLLVTAIVTAILYVTLSLLGIRFPVLLAFFSGAVSVIPVMGLWTAAILAATVATLDNARFFDSSPEITEGIAVFLIYIFLNIIIDYLIAPFFIGKSLDIHPLTLVLSVIAGTAVFGIPGAIFAVPVILVIKTIFNERNK